MWHACGREEVFTGFCLGGPKVRDHWKDHGVCGRIILEWKFGIVWIGVEWIHLALDSDQWGAVMNTVINFRVPQKAENFLTS
jgi:hypothetical protein